MALLENQTAIDAQDLFANRPAAGTRGRYFYATDTEKLYRDTGSAWKEINAIGGGGAGGALSYGGSGSEGSSARAARADHTHDLPPIPALPASQITSGTFDVARIPALPTSKVTSGTFDTARIPALPASQVTSGEFDTTRIPSLPASKVGSGTLDVARIPSLPASQINSGVLDSARVGFLIGEIKIWGTATAPAKHLLCNGAEVSRTTYPDLFALWGTTHGEGNGTTTFNLPDYRDLFLVGAGSIALHAKGGASSTTLSAANLPGHTHTIDHDHPSVNSSSAGTHVHTVDLQYATNTTVGGSGVRVTDVESATAGGGLTAQATINGAGAHTHSVDVPEFTGNSGNGPGFSIPFSNMPPYAAINFIVRALP